jgi:hypothetical protein
MRRAHVGPWFVFRPDDIRHFELLRLPAVSNTAPNANRGNCSLSGAKYALNSLSIRFGDTYSKAASTSMEMHLKQPGVNCGRAHVRV